MTAAERRHVDAVASLPCVVCGATCVQIHHVRRYGEPRNHMKVVALCWLHHLGKFGIHAMGKKAFERQFVTQDDMLKRTEQLLEGTCHTAI